MESEKSGPTFFIDKIRLQNDPIQETACSNFGYDRYNDEGDFVEYSDAMYQIDLQSDEQKANPVGGGGGEPASAPSPAPTTTTV